MLSSGSIISGAFRVFRERPLAFLIWSALYLAALVAMALGLRSLFSAVALGTSMTGFFGLMLPIYLLLLVLMLVLFNAGQRAVLRAGEPDRFFYLRLGLDELRTLALMIILFLVMMVLMFGIVMIFSMIAAGLAFAGGGFAGVGLVLIAMLGALAVMIWLEVRFSLVFPLTLMRRKIIIGESWTLTKGRFWTLFWAYFAIFVVYFLVTIAAGLMTQSSYWMEMMRGGFSPQAMQHAAEAQAAQQTGPIGLVTVIGWLVTAVAGVFGLAIGAGAIATAARALAVDNDQIAETFA